MLFVIPDLGIGGAQHVAATLARHLSPHKYEVHLALLTAARPLAKPPRPSFPAHVGIHCLGARRARYSIARLIALVWRLQPRLIFIAMAHLAPLILPLRTFFPERTRVVVRQNGPVSSVLNAMTQRRLVRVLVAAAYRLADAVICQTQSTAEELGRQLHLDRLQVRLLPNPVDIEAIRRSCSCRNTSREKSRPYLLAIGRLVPEKGFDLLLDAFAAVQRDIPEMRLVIAGSGPARTALQSQAQALGIDGRVDFPGAVASPSRYFPDALAYVLSSRQDEMPNALLEAAAAEMPIIAMPSSTGVADLLAGRPGVWLARSVSVAALEQAFRAALPRIGPGQRFQHEWIQPFALSSALAAYEQVFEEILNGASA